MSTVRLYKDFVEPEASTGLFIDRYHPGWMLSVD